MRTQPNELELEARLGVVSGPRDAESDDEDDGDELLDALSSDSEDDGFVAKPRFESGVSRSFFERAMKAMDSYRAWDSVDPDYVHTQDFFYDVGGQEVRTTAYYDPEQMLKQKLPRSHVIKTRIQTRDFIASGGQFDVRVSLSAEADMPTQHLPAAVQPKRVRTKLRRKFVKGHWSFELTKVWQASNGIEADRACQTSPPRFEIELELIKPRELLRGGEKGAKNRLVASCLLAKIVALMGNGVRLGLGS